MEKKDKYPYCTLSNDDLIKKAEEWIRKLIDSGGKEWTLRIPAEPNHDPDLIFSELCSRLKQQPLPASLEQAASNELKELARVYANAQTKIITENKDEIFDEHADNLKIWDFINDAVLQGADFFLNSLPASSPRWIKDKEGKRFRVQKYVMGGDGQEHVWSNDWHGHHIIGQDCEWDNENSLPATKENQEELWDAIINEVAIYYNGTEPPRPRFADVDVHIPVIIKNLKDNYFISKTSIPQTTVYVAVEVEKDKPEAQGWYATIGAEQVAYYYTDKAAQKVYEKWHGWDANVTHWLKEISIPDIIGEKDKEIEALRSADQSLQNKLQQTIEEDIKQFSSMQETIKQKEQDIERLKAENKKAIMALKIIAEGDPISVGLDEIVDVAKSGLPE